jgi:hypothetical protein
VRYRVREPLLAVRKEPGKKKAFITIEPGSLIITRGKVHPSGFVDVSYGGQVLEVFMRDIEKHADRVKGQTG